MEPHQISSLPLYCNERRLRHVTEELSSLTFALHLCFAPDGTGRAHASASHGAGGASPSSNASLGWGDRLGGRLFKFDFSSQSLGQDGWVFGGSGPAHPLTNEASDHLRAGGGVGGWVGGCGGGGRLILGTIAKKRRRGGHTFLYGRAEGCMSVLCLWDSLGPSGCGRGLGATLPHRPKQPARLPADHRHVHHHSGRANHCRQRLPGRR